MTTIQTTSILSRRQAVKRTLQALAGAALSPAIGSLAAAPAATLNVGILIPLTGPAALFGPSSKNCTELGIAEINARGGVAGRRIVPVYIDAGRRPEDVARDANAAWKSRNIEAFVGMHDSAVRAALEKLFNGRVCYIYTPGYEGGACEPGLYVLGETPSQLLEPVLPWLSVNRNLSRWFLIGNDYNWPRETNAAAKPMLDAIHSRVVHEEYLPFGTSAFGDVLDKIVATKADAVLITLVGASSVDFNRHFGASGLQKKVVRLGTLIEENTLAGIGAQNSENLYASSGYFASLPTKAAREFQARYIQTFGGDAPLLNVLAQSCYEGLRLLEVMGNKAGSLSVPRLEEIAQWQIIDGPRGMTVLHARHAIRDVYLARAEGTTFDVIKTFEAVRSGQSCAIVR